MSHLRSRLDAESYLQAENAKENARKRSEYEAAKKPEDARLAKFWGGPIETVKTYWKNPNVIDRYHGLKTPSKPRTDEECNVALLTFVQECRAEGVTFSDQGGLRLALYAKAHHLIGRDVGTLAAWYRVFARLRELNAFADGELFIAEKAKPETAKPDSLDSISTLTREGNAAAKRIVEQEVYGKDSEDSLLWKDWLTSLANNFKFYPTAEQQKLAIDVFMKLNLSFRQPKSYDFVRRYLGRQGSWPLMLSPEEKLDDQIENWRTEHPTSSQYEERIELRRLQKQFLNQA